MKTTLGDFTFKFKGSGHYKIIYKSPVTKKQWSRLITDMTLVDATKNEDNPKQKDLNWLKKVIKKL